MIKFYVLASGSKGNSTLIVLDNGEGILIDLGLSYSNEIEKLSSIGFPIENIKNIFITHNHIDHIRSIHKFASEKIHCLKNTVNLQGFCVLKPYTEYQYNGFSVTPLKTSHDAPDSCGYVFTINNEKLVYLTDSGIIPSKTEKYISNCEYYIFECNHDVDMLMESKRPDILKYRIIGDKGHLSNNQCCYYLSRNIGCNTKEIILSHVSEECNSDSAILNTVKEYFSDCSLISNIKIQIARQQEIVEG